MTAEGDTHEVVCEYRTTEERVNEWRTTLLIHQSRLSDLLRVPSARQGEESNLLRAPNVSTRVDSFLGTQNTRDVATAYFPVVHSAGGLAGSESSFRFESAPHPVFEELQQRFDLERIAGVGADLYRATALRSWIKSLWRHQEPCHLPPYDGLLILDRGSRGIDTFICMHYSVALVHCCLALGIQARLINLHCGIEESYEIGNPNQLEPPVSEHVTAEVWCRELNKWVMIDTDFDCHYERDSVPLSAWEIHQGFVSGAVASLVPHCGPGAWSEDEVRRLTRAHNRPDLYERVLPAYYAHVSILMRNNFLTDPDGPTPVLHLTDDLTPPILWHGGEDMRLRPDLLGPLVVATPYRDQITLLTDGLLRRGWASADTDTHHWAEFALPEDVDACRAVLHWPEWQRHYRTSRTYRLDARIAGVWRPLIEVHRNPERAWTVHDFPPIRLDGLRITQPPTGGFPDHPHRLWLTQVELYGSRSPVRHEDSSSPRIAAQ